MQEHRPIMCTKKVCISDSQPLKQNDYLMKENTFNENLQLFEDKPICTAWSENDETWYFAIIDVICVLTESKNPAAYWLTPQRGKK